MSEKTMPKTAAAPSVKGQPLVPRIFSRDSIEHHIHTFKTTVSQMTKNRSWQKTVFTPEKIEHCHIYHSHSERGQSNKHTTATGGHFHEVEVIYGEGGAIETVKCGPPLKRIEKQVGNTVKTFIRPVEWKVRDAEDPEQGWTTFKDEHTHEFLYLGSEVFSNHKKKEIMEANGRALPAKFETKGKGIAPGAEALAGELQSFDRDK